MGKTSVVKHNIKLTNQTQFKERCMKIPHNQYEDVRKHLKEMLEGGNQKFNNLWASATVLVMMKEREPGVLHRPDNIDIAYSLSRIDDTF